MARCYSYRIWIYIEILVRRPWRVSLRISLLDISRRVSMAILPWTCPNSADTSRRKLFTFAYNLMPQSLQCLERFLVRLLGITFSYCGLMFCIRCCMTLNACGQVWLMFWSSVVVRDSGTVQCGYFKKISDVLVWYSSITVFAQVLLNIKDYNSKQQSMCL